MVRATCSALHCASSSRTHKDLKFHQFPHDWKRRKMWLLACKRSDVIDKDQDFFKHKYVCSKHFQKSMYSKKDYHRKSAVPSLYLSEKPLQHDSSTQTVASIQYVQPYFEQNEDVKERLYNVTSILYVTKSNVKKRARSTYTQTVDMPDDIHPVNIKEETITDKKIKESESGKQQVKIKTENDDDENSDSTAFEEDLETQTEDNNYENCDSNMFEEDIKIEIVENPILPLAQYTQCRDQEIIKDSKTLCTQAEKLLQEINKGETADMIPIMRRRDVSVQTDRVIVLSQHPEGKRGESINPIDCKCKKNTYDEMTRSQFFRCCRKFLSPSFTNLVRTQMYLDGVTKQVELGGDGSGSEGEGMLKCDEEEIIKHLGAIAPELVVTGTQLDGVTRVENDEVAGSSAGLAKGAQGRDAKRRRVATPELNIADIITIDSDEDELSDS